jgi:hypothetical protein
VLRDFVAFLNRHLVLRLRSAARHASAALGIGSRLARRCRASAAALGRDFESKTPFRIQIRHLLSALAPLNGHFSLAFVLEGLDAEIECPNCGTFVDPMASKLS